MNPELNFR